jgi:hypothetical protein
MGKTGGILDATAGAAVFVAGYRIPEQRARRG